MSRVPRTTRSSTSLRGQYKKSASTPTKSNSALPSKLRLPTSTPSRTAVPSETSARNADKATDGKISPTKERTSLKEQIALKRAEMKKAQTQASLHTGNDENDPGTPFAVHSPVRSRKEEEDIVELGRWSVRETVERARSTGNINLSSRSLVCIPSCLFEIHLGVTPNPLPSVTEPNYAEEDNSRRRRQNRQQLSWFEAQDLMVLKARSNEIVELQPELSLFGNLKTIDLHGNLLHSLPESLTLLSMLTILDVSNNKLSELPPSIFSLPSLTNLDISHNELISLPLSKFNKPLESSNSFGSGGFFEPEVKRADAPLPRLHNFNASHNKLTAHAIDHDYLPSGMTTVNLAHNPLGKSSNLLSALAELTDLQVLHLEGDDIGDESIKSLAENGFPKLNTLDLGETRITEQAVRSSFSGNQRESRLNFSISTSPPLPGELRVVVGKRVIREQWEIDADQQYLKKKKSMVSVSSELRKDEAKKPPLTIEKEPWEIETEQGLSTEGGRRRARAATAISANIGAEPLPASPRKTTVRPKVVEKEAWEIEAEQGLLTEGGRRRLRAQQAAAAASASQDKDATTSSTSLANSSYYSAKDLSLVLPPSNPPSRGHARAFSLAATSRNQSKPEDLLIPTPTFPLNIIVRQNFAATLRVLSLNNRRADPTVSFPTASFVADALQNGGVLPRLEELYLEGCSLDDTVILNQEQDNGDASSKSQKQSLLALITSSFPSLTILDLSYNNVSSDALSESNLKKLLLSSSDAEPRKGLKVLRLRGNGLVNLDGFDAIAEMFKGNRQVSEWRLEELDVRDNNISKLPVNLGMLPLDVFLVDGNTFRIPPRKVWEREGTKGLLNWLRSRID